MLSLLETIDEICTFAPGSGTGGTPPTRSRMAPHEAGRYTKKTSDWAPPHVAGDYETELSWDMMCARARDVIRNEPILSKSLNALSTLILGIGIYTFSCASNPDGEEIEDFIIASDRAYERWADGEADFYNERSAYEIQRLLLEDAMQVGNSLAIEVIDRSGDRSVPLSYQIVEWEQMARERDTLGNASDGQARIQNGIEYDRYGRKTHYHIYDVHPHGNNMATTENIRRIPASRVIHYYYPRRSSSSTGNSWFANVMLVAKDFDRYWANELTASSIDALTTFAVKTDQDRLLGLDAIDEETGELAVKVGYGNMALLGTNDSVEAIRSGRPPGDAAPWLDMLVGRIAQGVWLSENRVKSDASKGSLASLKASHQDDAAMAERLQRHFSERVALRMRRRHNELAVASGLYRGLLSASQFSNDKRKWQQFQAVAATKASDVTPKDDVIATAGRLRTGISSWPEEVMKTGKNPREVLRKIRWTNERTKDEGIALDFSAGNGNQRPVTSTSEMDEEDATVAEGRATA